MSDRYTRKDAEAAFARLASALGKTWSVTGALFEGNYWESKSVGTLWTREGSDNRAHVGAWTLDCNPTYGGYVIEEIANEGGGVTQPFGSMRRNAREFCDAVYFAENAIRFATEDMDPDATEPAGIWL
jgi:hypothetical protein